MLQTKFNRLLNFSRKALGFLSNPPQISWIYTRLRQAYAAGQAVSLTLISQMFGRQAFFGKAFSRSKLL
jgi:hypothetical protein